jgi:hypothetical protein
MKSISSWGFEMSTDVSRKVKITENAFDDRIESECHYEYQSTADIFSFHINRAGEVESIFLSPEVAHLLREAIESASQGKMGTGKSEVNRFRE